jgi:hypothetical protein
MAMKHGCALPGKHIPTSLLTIRLRVTTERAAEIEKGGRLALVVAQTIRYKPNVLGLEPMHYYTPSLTHM